MSHHDHVQIQISSYFWIIWAVSSVGLRLILALKKDHWVIIITLYYTGEEGKGKIWRKRKKKGEVERKARREGGREGGKGKREKRREGKIKKKKEVAMRGS